MTEISTSSPNSASRRLENGMRKLKKQKKKPMQIKQADPNSLADSLDSIRQYRKKKAISRKVKDAPTRSAGITVDPDLYLNEIKQAWEEIQANLNEECRVLKDAIRQYLNLRFDSIELGDLITNSSHEKFAMNFTMMEEPDQSEILDALAELELIRF